MSRIVRSARSLSDATDIWRYIALDDPASADRQIRLFDEKLRFLSDWPYGGSPRPDLGRGVRTLAVGRYIILYRPIVDGIRILRIVSGGRQLPPSTRGR